MSELKIPEAAYTAGANAYDDADPDSGWSEAIDAAAPLIVAAELRSLTKQGTHPEFSRARWALNERANELDPQGVTK